VLYYVLKLCIVISTLRVRPVLTVLWVGFCHSGPNFTVHRFICVHLRVFCVFLFHTAYVFYYCEHSGVDLMGSKRNPWNLSSPSALTVDTVGWVIWTVKTCSQCGKWCVWRDVRPCSTSTQIWLTATATQRCPYTCHTTETLTIPKQRQQKQQRHNDIKYQTSHGTYAVHCGQTSHRQVLQYTRDTVSNKQLTHCFNG